MLVPLADADIDQVRRIHTKHGGSLEAADALPAAAQKPGDHAENDEAKRVDDGKDLLLRNIGRGLTADGICPCLAAGDGDDPRRLWWS